MQSPAGIKIQQLLLLSAIVFFSFDDPLKVTIRSRHDHFSADNLGNMYLLKGEELIKYLPGGKFVARYSNLKLGDITSIDVTNPLKIILYYRDFQQVVFLDNQLSANSSPLSLEKLGYEQAELVCAGSNNGFWIYNKQNNELVRFNENSKPVISTGNLKPVLNADLVPDFMLEHNGYLFLNSPETGIYVFDIFGAFSKVISLKGLNSFDVGEDVIYYQRDNLLCSYQHRLFEESCKSLPEPAPKAVKYVNHRLFTDYADSLVSCNF
jgi:hypothetical protein